MSYYIAHRGNRKSAPQNTMKAFEKAFETGTDGIELDVHLTKDNRIVICHNYDIEPTSNGKGLISEMTYDELYKFDFGEGEHIPLLSSLLERNYL